MEHLLWVTFMFLPRNQNSQLPTFLLFISLEHIKVSSFLLAVLQHSIPALLSIIV